MRNGLATLEGVLGMARRYGSELKPECRNNCDGERFHILSLHDLFLSPVVLVSERPAVAALILVAEGYAARVAGDEPAVRDGNTVGVAAR